MQTISVHPKLPDKPTPLLKVHKRVVETPGIEPGASRMRSERSTTELHPHEAMMVRSPLDDILSWTARLAEWSKA